MQASDTVLDRPLAVNEHELSLFNLAEYKEFQKDPEVRPSAGEPVALISAADSST